MKMLNQLSHDIDGVVLVDGKTEVIIPHSWIEQEKRRRYAIWLSHIIRSNTLPWWYRLKSQQERNKLLDLVPKYVAPTTEQIIKELLH